LSGIDGEFLPRWCFFKFLFYGHPRKIQLSEMGSFFERETQQKIIKSRDSPHQEYWELIEEPGARGGDVNGGNYEVTLGKG
jgi:hypothetical protein